jgi:hypothetical protein
VWLDFSIWTVLRFREHELVSETLKAFDVRNLCSVATRPAAMRVK